MAFNNSISPSVGADYAVSKLHVDYQRSQSSTQFGIIIRSNF
jgi:hypothetical protein